MNPAIFCDTQVQKEVIPKVMQGVIGTVLDAHRHLIGTDVH